jgi:hypothetical protein
MTTKAKTNDDSLDDRENLAIVGRFEKHMFVLFAAASSCSPPRQSRDLKSAVFVTRRSGLAFVAAGSATTASVRGTAAVRVSRPTTTPPPVRDWPWSPVPEVAARWALAVDRRS